MSEYRRSPAFTLLQGRYNALQVPIALYPANFRCQGLTLNTLQVWIAESSDLVLDRPAPKYALRAMQQGWQSRLVIRYSRAAQFSGQLGQSA
jgi:hypothetical protein